MDTFFQDIRYSFRALLAKSGFTIAAILTLALGIGANTAIFSVIDGALVRPMPYPEDERLVIVYNHYPNMLDYAGTSIWGPLCNAAINTLVRPTTWSCRARSRRRFN